MALKEDYIVKMFQEVIEILFKTIGVREDETEIVKSVSGELQDKYQKLNSLVEEKNINEAENYLFDNLDLNNQDDYVIGLLFFKKLSELDEEYLKECDYSKEEIVDGIIDLSKKFGLDEVLEFYLDT